MIDRKHVKIHLGPGCHTGSYVEIDGVRQTNVRAVELGGSVDSLAWVRLELVNVELEVVAEEADVSTTEDVTAIGDEVKKYRAG